ncbi:ABC transporter substrate-binding protein [Salinibacterium sp. G-O1]|uniref:ABC transporter substrate-binding protein n=1 Tax=Salinibacterium sp. G-O1 TaxID=3046208 RepID=UPI0024BAE757|nr:ABC transporter substrate-binding protein [Salinibacterium sp. G-O1]MDJ0336400.1 ABC transporter substrate-binding protein [Salinibacterium sp. G-O1]
MRNAPRNGRLGRRTAAVAAAAVSVALAVSGCVSAVDSQPESTPAAGGILQIVQGADISPSTLMSQNNPNFSINRLVFNSLVELDHKTLEPTPELATEWDLSDDGLTLAFTLREGVTFHDGKAFTSADVIGSIQTLLRDDVPSQLKHVAKKITDMVADDDLHVTLTFSQRMSNMFDLFEMMRIVDVDTVDKLLTGEEFNGTGPFKVDTYTPGQGLELTKNEDYWKDGAPLLDGVEITVVRDSQSMLSSLKSGQSDLALDLAPLDASTLASDQQYEVVQSDAFDSTYYLGSNVSVPLLSDNRVRQAIAYSIDRDRVLQQVLGGVGQTTSLPWSPASPAYDESKANFYDYDIAKAKDLLNEASATGASINVYYDAGFAPNVGLAEIVEFNLTEAGLKPNMMPVQAAEFLDKLRSGGFDGLFMTGHGFGQLNPATLVKGAFPYNADKNASGFDNQEYKDLANAVWTGETGDKVATDALNDFLLDQQFVSDIVNTTHTFSISNKVKGLAWTMLDYIDLDQAYFG